MANSNVVTCTLYPVAEIELRLLWNSSFHTKRWLLWESFTSQPVCGTFTENRRRSAFLASRGKQRSLRLLIPTAKATIIAFTNGIFCDNKLHRQSSNVLWILMSCTDSAKFTSNAACNSTTWCTAISVGHLHKPAKQVKSGRTIFSNAAFHVGKITSRSVSMACATPLNTLTREASRRTWELHKLRTLHIERARSKHSIKTGSQHYKMLHDRGISKPKAHS